MAASFGSAVTHTLEGAEEDRLWGWIHTSNRSVLARHRNAMVLYTHLAIQNVGPALQAKARVAPDYTMILPPSAGRQPVTWFGIDAIGGGSAFRHAVCQLRFGVSWDAAPGSSAEVAHCPTEAKPHFDVWAPRRQT